MLKLPHAILSPLFLVTSVTPRWAQDFAECTRVLHVLEGEAAGDLFGWVTAPMADVNGDGVQELLVAAVGHGAGRGRVQQFDGRTGVERFRFDGQQSQEFLGYSLREAGDVNGDGIPDVIAGGQGSPTRLGVARVLSGADGMQLRIIRIGVTGDEFGHSVTGIGDVDMDGTPDVAIGATLEDGAGTDAGRVYVVSGADGVTVLRELAGEGPGHHFGSSLAALGDVNGDGIAELAIGAADAGAFGRGRAYVFDLVTGTRLYRVAPDTSGVEFGQFFIAAAGEIDGDGLPDMYVGDYADGNGRGKAYLFAGATGARLRTFTGANGSGFGIGRPLGDVDGDGLTEMVFGSWTDSSGAPQAGKAEVFAGSDGRLLRRVTSGRPGENFGYDAHGLGDVDGDGTPDLAVSAASFGNSRGRVYVIAREPIVTYGTGLAGSAGLVPALTLLGCPRPGETVSLDVSGGLGGAFGLVLIGARRLDLPFRGGTLHPDPFGVQIRHRLGGAPGVAGAGSVSLPWTIPADPALLGLVFHAQTLHRDPGAPLRIALSAALELRVY